MKKVMKRSVTLLCVLALLFSLASPAFAAKSDAYFPRYTGTSGSIVNGLNAVGVNSSYSYRSQIAQANGISGYRGTPEQNTAMLKLLKQGTLLKPGAQPPAATAPSAGASGGCFPRYTGTSGSIVTGLQSVGAQSSYSYRSQIAQANGISGYRGTPEQNTAMLKLLKQGTLLKPGASQTASSSPVTQTKVSVAESGSVTWYDAVKKAPVRNAPYETGTVLRYAAKGSTISVVGSTVNKHGNRWYITGNGGYIYAGNVKNHSHAYQSVTYEGITYNICDCGRVTVTYKTTETVKLKQANSLASAAVYAGMAAAADGPVPAGDLIGAGILMLGAYYYLTGATMNQTTSIEVLKELDFDKYIKERKNTCSEQSFRMVTRDASGLHYKNDRCLDWYEAYVYVRYMKGDVYTTYGTTAKMLGMLHEGGCYVDRDGGQPTYFYHVHLGDRSHKVGGHIFFGYNDYGQGPT